MSENGHHRHHFEFADFRLYPLERLLTNGGSRVAMTPRVMDLLIILVEHKGALVSKETLLSSMWAGSFVEEGNISRAISTLRKNLGTQSNGGDFIETVPKIGYRFIAPVQESVAKNGFDPIVLPPPKTRTARAKIWIALGAVLLAAAGIYFSFDWAPAKPLVVGGLTNLTNNLADDDLPAWSPDGSRITFTSNRDGAGDIYVMNADGGGVTRLTFTSAKESASIWSPDGTKIVFDSDRDGNREIYIMDADGSNQTRLTFNPTADAGPVSFSPDGRRIAFSRNASNEGLSFYNYDIFVMNTNGGEARQLTRDPEFDAEPVWSPDGGRIIFITGRDRNFEIYAINPDGSGEINITNSPDRDGIVAFTADGSHIFCVTDSPSRPEFSQIRIINADGSAPRQITSFADKVFRAAYSEQTHKFAVVGKKEGNYEIYAMEASNPPVN